MALPESFSPQSNARYIFAGGKKHPSCRVYPPPFKKNKKEWTLFFALCRKLIHHFVVPHFQKNENR